MFIDATTKRVNIYAPFTTSWGVTYANLTDPVARSVCGVVEIPDPATGDPRFYYNQELDYPPYMTVTPKSVETIRAQLEAQVKTIENAETMQQFMFGGFLYDSRWQVLELASATADRNWQDASGAWHTITVLDRMAFIAAMETRLAAVTSYAKSLDVQIATLPFAGLVALNVESGWPAP
jgi:hypothetical protein